MPPTLQVEGRGPITTYESASKEEFNVISRLGHAPAVKAQADDLWRQRRSIEALTRQQLGLSKRDACNVLEPHEWIRGGFNICVMLDVEARGRRNKVVFRCPMPHKLAEARYPGTVDEKLSCEVGAYVYMQEKCPDVRIPNLYGFGFVDGRQFTHVGQRSFLMRISHMFWRCVYGLLNYPVLSQYVRNTTHHNLPSAYMLLEYIDSGSGQMLSTTWDKHRNDPARRQNLFRGMSNIILSLARLLQPRIGSFQFNNDGTITLTNRPLHCSTILLENDGAPRTIPPTTTYTCTSSFVSDALTFHDARFLAQPNAVYSEGDCRGQMAVHTLLRALSHRYVNQDHHRRGPFLLQLTDLHASNIFVDAAWNVACLIDLEWLCALPAEALAVPYWLTGCSIDEVRGERYGEFDAVQREFMGVLEEQEREREREGKTRARHGITVSKVMREMWEGKGVWFWHCLASVNAMYFLVESHLCPKGALSLDAERALSRFWGDDSEAVVRKKMADREAYDVELKRVFDE